MATEPTSRSDSARASLKHRFLDAYEREHETTVRVLEAYPADRLDLRPHERCKTARELAWVFVVAHQLGETVFDDRFEEVIGTGGGPPPPPDSWDELLEALDEAHVKFGELVRSTPEPELHETVRFFVGPQTMGDVPKIDWLWFLLHDQIHHRGQFSIYLRMADGKVPSIYGPSGDEPWM